MFVTILKDFERDSDTILNIAHVGHHFSAFDALKDISDVLGAYFDIQGDEHWSEKSGFHYGGRFLNIVSFEDIIESENLSKIVDVINDMLCLGQHSKATFKTKCYRAGISKEDLKNFIKHTRYIGIK